MMKSGAWSGICRGGNAWQNEQESVVRGVFMDCMHVRGCEIGEWVVR